MAVYAKRNTSTGFFDLGPPMYVVSEDTSPNATHNPAFELAYWRFGREHASAWMERLGEDVPAAWTEVRENLAPLPMEGGLYAVYEGPWISLVEVRPGHVQLARRPPSQDGGRVKGVLT